MSSFAELHARLQKPAPRAIGREDRKRDEDRTYRENSLKARARDGFRCRICGAHFGLETHHVKPRSLNRRSRDKHAVSRLLTVCGPSMNTKSCHGQLTKKTMRLFANSDQGADGTFTVEKFDTTSKQWQVAMRAA